MSAVRMWKLCGVLAGVVLLFTAPTACTGKKARPSFQGTDETEAPTSVSSMISPVDFLKCPDSGEGTFDVRPGQTGIISGEQRRSLTASGGGISFHVFPGANLREGADLVVCGGGATLILEAEANGGVLIAGGAARLILVNGTSRPDADHLRLEGGGTSVIRCYQGPLRLRKAVRCSTYF